MGIDYSFLADWLNKFHTSTPLIQALWLTAIAITPIGVTVSICWCLRGIVSALAQKQHREPIGQTLYSVAQMEDGELRIFRHVPDLAEINREALRLLANRSAEEMPAGQLPDPKAHGAA
jgi:hypothetical protein